MANSKTRNISNKNLADIYKFIENFHPSCEKEKRNLIILKYAYIDNMSARTIANLDDPRLVSFGNRNNKGRIHEKTVRDVIRSYNLEYEKKIDYSVRKNYGRRRDLNAETLKSKRPKICSCCGSTSKLELHHIMPIYLGGNDDYYNLAYFCHDCHLKMHDLIEIIFDKFKKNRNLK